MNETTNAALEVLIERLAAVGNLSRKSALIMRAYIWHGGAAQVAAQLKNQFGVELTGIRRAPSRLLSA